jgi:hypothetical protein
MDGYEPTQQQFTRVAAPPMPPQSLPASSPPYVCWTISSLV